MESSSEPLRTWEESLQPLPALELSPARRSQQGLTATSNVVILRDDALSRLVLYEPRTEQVTLWTAQPQTTDASAGSAAPGESSDLSSAAQTPFWRNLFMRLAASLTEASEIDRRDSCSHPRLTLPMADRCPMCQRPFDGSRLPEGGQLTSLRRVSAPQSSALTPAIRLRADYFEVLSRIHQASASLLSDEQKQSQAEAETDGGSAVATTSISEESTTMCRSNGSEHISEEIRKDKSSSRIGQSEMSEIGSVSRAAMNTGYYERFFGTVRRLGSGSYGSVFLCRHVLEQVSLGDFAVKIVPVGDNRTRLVEILREVRALQSLHHVNVVDYKHSWLEMHQPAINGPDVPCLFILMEFADGGSVMDYIMTPATHRSAAIGEERKRRLRRPPLKASSFYTVRIDAAEYRQRQWLAESEVWTIMFETCMGLAHLHANGIVHRDLKPGNLLMSSLQSLDTVQLNGEELYHNDYRVLISDLGQSAFVHSGECPAATGETGTLGFAPPGADRWNESSDIWSLGHILYFLAFSAWPYENMCSDEAALALLIEGGMRLDIPRGGRRLRSPVMLQMITRLTRLRAEERPSLRTVIVHIAKVLQMIRLHSATQQQRSRRPMIKSTTRYALPPPMSPQITEASGSGTDDLEADSRSAPSLVASEQSFESGPVVLDETVSASEIAADAGCVKKATSARERKKAGDEVKKGINLEKVENESSDSTEFPELSEEVSEFLKRQSTADLLKDRSGELLPTQSAKGRQWTHLQKRFATCKAQIPRKATDALLSALAIVAIATECHSQPLSLSSTVFVGLFSLHILFSSLGLSLVVTLISVLRLWTSTASPNFFDALLISCNVLCCCLRFCETRDFL